MHNEACEQDAFDQKSGMFKRIAGFVKSLFRRDRDHSAMVLQARVYRNFGMSKETVKAYEKIVKINPDNAEAHYELGTVYLEQGKNKEAVESLKQAVSNRSKYVEALYKLSIAYGNLGRISEAISTTKRLISIKPDFLKAYKNLGVFYGKVEMYREAIDALKSAVRIKPEDADTRYRLVNSLLDVYEMIPAQQEYEKLKELSPGLALKIKNRLK